MNTFKKLIALMLCLCMIFTFASCETITDLLDEIMPGEKDDTTDSTDDTTGGTDDTEGDIITKNEWDAAASEDKFNNVTFTMLVTFKGETETYPVICKLDGNSASMQEDDYEEEIVDAETAAAIRSVYMNTILAVLESYENFTYDLKAGAFVSSKDIVYNVTVIEYDATITASNVKVKIDANKNIAEISCAMKQEYVDGSDTGVLELDVVFTFSNYGTTVVGSSNDDNSGDNSETTDLATAYSSSCAGKNVTMDIYALEILNDGTEKPENYVYKTTASSLYMSSPYGDQIYSIENGSTCIYMKTESGWVKSNVQTNAPIGTLVEMYVGMFESVFDAFTYDASTNTYSAANLTIAQYGGMSFDSVSIEIKDGMVYQLKYVMDTFDYSGDTPVVHGKGYATHTFSDYGKTVVELPENYTDNTNGGGTTGGNGGNVDDNPVNTKVSEDEWNDIFDKMGNTSNVTITMDVSAEYNDGRAMNQHDMLKTTDVASNTIDRDTDDQTFHSIEDGNYYNYYLSGDTWHKRNVTSGYAPIGSAVMQQYVTTFRDLYSALTYDEESCAYVGTDVVATQNGQEFVLPEFSIKFVDGKFSEIYYTSYAYTTNADGERVVSGIGTMLLKFSDFGVTVVELPSDYIDETAAQ